MPQLLVRVESWSCRSPLLVVHHIIKSVVLRPGGKKVARNAPKHNSSHLYRAGVFVPVVARPIQDMSEVSITDKTVGVRLPRLRCRAIGWRTKHPIKFHPAPKLDALTAEEVFGWKKTFTSMKVRLSARKQDRGGRWCLAKVPYYSTNPVLAYPIEERMRQLGRLDRYQKELAKVTRSKNIPSDWASPDQCCRAAIKAVGRYRRA